MNVGAPPAAGAPAPKVGVAGLGVPKAKGAAVVLGSPALPAAGEAGWLLPNVKPIEGAVADAGVGFEDPKLKAPAAVWLNADGLAGVDDAPKPLPVEVDGPKLKVGAVFIGGTEG